MATVRYCLSSFLTAILKEAAKLGMRYFFFCESRVKMVFLNKLCLNIAYRSAVIIMETERNFELKLCVYVLHSYDGLVYVN
jgi:hypothetical protein